MRLDRLLLTCVPRAGSLQLTDPAAARARSIRFRHRVLLGEGMSPTTMCQGPRHWRPRLNQRIQRQTLTVRPDQRPPWDIVPTGRFIDDHAFPADSHQHVIAFVPALLQACRPATILWRVVAVIIDALDQRARRTWSHICRKGLERLAPAVAYGNATPAVIGVLGACRQPTSLTHGGPHAVQRSLRLAMCFHGGHSISPPVVR